MPAVTNLKSATPAAIQALAELYKMGFIEEVGFSRFSLMPKTIRSLLPGHKALDIIYQDVVCEDIPGEEPPNSRIIVTCSQQYGSNSWTPVRAKILKSVWNYFERRTHPTNYWVWFKNKLAD